MLGIAKLSFHLTSLLASYELLERHEMEDDLVDVDCMMVVKEIENGLLEEVEKLEWWFEQDINDEGEEDKEDGGGDEV
ncbi:hypothetical protein Tco_1025717 [Tanacetum coccineum]